MTPYLLRRHPFAIEAHFDFSLVLTYALPLPALEPLLSPGLVLDRLGERGFLAIALVQARDLRPAGWPRVLGRDFFLTGYRIFVRVDHRPSLRGLRIIRSDADSRLMVLFGNVFTRYGYTLCAARHHTHDESLAVDVSTPGAVADLALRIRLDTPAALPEGSPFADLAEARRFAGPLPHTFDYEPESRSLIDVHATRGRWEPQPVTVEQVRSTFLERERFASSVPVLANAFLVRDVDYRWDRGKRLAIP